MTTPAPDWRTARAETLLHLQRMIGLNTVNPPGNEMQVARYLDGVLREEGIETHVFEPAPGRAAFIARLAGTGAKRPVLLLAHMDVVGVEREHWSVDPFAGVIKDGFLYGRGAIDDKGMLAANLETMLLLKRNGFTGFLLDDHVPHMIDDTPWAHRGRAHAIGYMQGLLRAIETLT